jgi:hypothetical protein
LKNAPKNGLSDHVSKDGDDRSDGFALVALIVASFILRVVIAVKGGQYFWTDESRFVLSQRAADDFVQGKFAVGFDALFSNSGHLLFEVIGVLPALLEKAFGGRTYVPAIFFGCFSLGVIYLVSRLVRSQGGSSREGVLAAFLVAACNSFFYYARHIFPYDAALCFYLAAALVGFRPGPLKGVLAGVLCGLGFLTYNAYWAFGGTILALTVVAQRRGLWQALERSGYSLLGLFLPILAAVGIGRLFGHDLIRSFYDFSHVVASDTGDRGIAWRIIPQYLWVSEHFLFLVLGLGVPAALFLCAIGRGAGRVGLWVFGAILFYLGQVVVFDVLKIFFVCARHARPELIFLCLVGSWLLAKAYYSGWMGRLAVQLILVAILVQSVVNFSTPLRQMFPHEFDNYAQAAIEDDADRDPGLYAIIDGGYSGNAFERRPYVVLYKSPHPLQFPPYTYDDYTEVMRKAFRDRDISMRAVRLLPERPEGRVQISRFTGPWAPYLGAMRLEVIFDPDRISGAQPILSSGKPGAGDQLFVEFLDKNTLRLGFDHWNFPAIYSEAIHCDMGGPHVVEVSTGSLYPPDYRSSFAGEQAWRILRHTLYVRFDGKAAISLSADSYPSLPHSVILFHNYIGFSTAERDFTGRLLSASSVPTDEIVSGIESRR